MTNICSHLYESDTIAMQTIASGCLGIESFNAAQNIYFSVVYSGSRFDDGAFFKGFVKSLCCTSFESIHIFGRMTISYLISLKLIKKWAMS